MLMGFQRRDRRRPPASSADSCQPQPMDLSFISTFHRWAPNAEGGQIFKRPLLLAEILPKFCRNSAEILPKFCRNSAEILTKFLR